jgi:hypothetical protein
MDGQDARQSLVERAERAVAVPRRMMAPFFEETAKEVLIAFARNPNLQECDLLRLLQRKDLPAEVLREVAVHPEAKRNYAVKLALVQHPHTPRLISLSITKFLYLFDLVRVSHAPAVPTEIKMLAEETILKGIAARPRGEKISLARRATGRVAAALLVTEDRELVRAALDNPFLTEANLIRVLALENLPAAVVELIATHQKWSTRYHLRLALVRNPLTPLVRVLAFLPDLALTDLRTICLDRRMPEHVRRYVLNHCAERLGKKPDPPAAS